MRRYFETLHTKPDEHKRRFAFLFSAGFTLLIFSVWSLVNFVPSKSATMALGESDKEEVNQASPFRAFRYGAAAAYQAVMSNFGKSKDEPELESISNGR